MCPASTLSTESQNTLPGHMLPAPTSPAEQGLEGSEDMCSGRVSATGEPGTGWRRNGLSWAVTLPRPQVCLLTPIHWVLNCSQFTLTFRLPPQSWAELLHQGPSCCSNPVLSTSGWNCSPDAQVRHKLAQQPLPTEKLWPASLLGVETEPPGCHGKNSHPSPAGQFCFSSPHVQLWVTLKAFQQDWSCL